MKAVRLVAVNQPLERQNVSVPEIGERDVLVQVRAAGICHSDVHYRDGISPTGPLPLTLGHEIAGVVTRVGAQVTRLEPGARVCLHYNLSCGDCYRCTSGNDQFCQQAAMLGHHVDGGYAEYIVVPARNAIRLPDGIPFEQGATLMCASATAFHALRKSRLRAGETVAILGAGGLGQSAVQLARALGALEVYAVDIDQQKLRLAEQHGAIPIDASEGDAADRIRALTGGRGVDVAIELIGLRTTIEQSLRSVGALGRAVIVGLSGEGVEIDTYSQLVGREAELIGS
ncbi:MAG: alcohol dehydrogenase catalytic domain-containing protein, partial [Gammaproteobacteria bacterium]